MLCACVTLAEAETELDAPARVAAVGSGGGLVALVWQHGVAHVRLVPVGTRQPAVGRQACTHTHTHTPQRINTRL